MFHVFGKKPQTLVWIVCRTFKNTPTPLLTIPERGRRVCVHAAVVDGPQPWVPQTWGASGLPDCVCHGFSLLPIPAYFYQMCKVLCASGSQRTGINRTALAARAGAACVQYHSTNWLKTNDPILWKLHCSAVECPFRWQMEQQLPLQGWGKYCFTNGQSWIS